MSSSTINAGESVTFTNISDDMDRCEWLFGDGESSTEKSPVHTYNDPGSFEVTLRVFSKNDLKADVSTQTLTVNQPTTLWVNCKYPNENNIPGATVILYRSYNDWYNDNSRTATAVSESNGRAVFTNISSGLYYISIYKAVDATYFYCNWFTEYSYNLYKTTVVANKINEVRVITTYAYNSTKKGPDIQ